MNVKAENKASQGIAKTVLVFRDTDTPKAFVTQIVAKRRKSTASTRIRFQGPAVFTKKVAHHIRKIVWPVADSALSFLTCQPYGFDLSVSNLAAASSKEVAVDISGFSADMSVFVAILSAGMGIPVRENLVFTGHIAGSDGSIRMVSGIPEKAEALINSPGTDMLVHPDLASDPSMAELSPNEAERIAGALSQAKERIRLAPVRDVGDLVKIAYNEIDILAASLKEGFFHLPEHRLETNNPVHQAVYHLTFDLEARLWRQLHADFSHRHCRKAVSLLTDITDAFIQKGSYLSQAGQNLFRVVASLPPDIRRLSLNFPLLPVSKCTEFCRNAGKSQSKDAWLFLKACSGEVQPSTIARPPAAPEAGAADREIDQSLESIISEIENDRLTSAITVKIDNARASYAMDSVVSCSHDHFCNAIASYFIHLSRHLHGFSGPVDMDAAGAEGLEVLEKAFMNKGGFAAALAEARHATNGGMRYVLDVFTEQYKREQIEKHVGRIFKLAMDPLDWDRKVRLMASVVDRLKNILPSEISTQPAERFAVHYEPIVKALAQSRDQLTSVFRSF